jgi:YHS domain-containing protein
MLEYDLDPQGRLRLLYGMRLHGGLRIASWRCGIALLAAVLLGGCGGAVNVVSEGADSDLMLRGNDAVAYFAAGRTIPGSSEIKAEHRGLTYRFASVESRRQFITNPERYVPQFGGFCAQAMAYAVPTATDANTFKIIDGKLYLFDSPRARLYFEMDQERNLKLAWHYWETEVQDSAWRLQAWKRLVWRVPHYKSDAELDEEYARRFGRKPG